MCFLVDDGGLVEVHFFRDVGWETMPIPPDSERVPATGGNTGDLFYVRFHVADGILV